MPKVLNRTALFDCLIQRTILRVVSQLKICQELDVWQVRFNSEGEVMLQSVMTVVLLFFAMPAFGQLGPKDGANLAPTDLQRIKVADAAPDFSLENMDGKAVTLSDFRGKKNVILLFYRGHW